MIRYFAHKTCKDEKNSACITIRGCRITCLDLETFFSDLEKFISRGVPAQIVTLNSLMVEGSIRDKEMETILRESEISVIDSVGIQCAVFLKYGLWPGKLPGIDLVRRLAAWGRTKRLSFFLYGGRESSNRLTAERLKAEFPGLTVAGRSDGFSEDENVMADKIRSSGADILLVGLDAARQEKWIRRNLKRTGTKAAIGIGGSFDVLSGTLPRSPGFLRSAGLEWLFRFLIEPWRIGRILRLPVFIIKLFFWSFKRCL